MRAAVVGAGDISAVHLAALTTLGIEVAAVVDHDLTVARRAGEPLGAAPLDDVGTALAEIGVDVVHVCTPHDQHLPVVLAALDAGAHVLVEKPLAHRLEDAEALAAAAAAATTKVGVCLQNRYNPTSQELHRVLRSGELGRVLAASAAVTWSRPEPYYARKRWAGQGERAGGGALINQAIHTLDLLQWLLGPVTAVAGRAFRLRPIPGVDVEDTATLVLTHAPPSEPPVLSTMWATTAHAVVAPVQIDVTCERGSLHLRGELTIVGPSGIRTVSDAAPDGGGPSYWGASHQALIADFYASLSAPGPFWIDPAAALPAQRILTEVYAQSRR